MRPSYIVTTKTFPTAWSFTPNARATVNVLVILVIEALMTSYKPVRHAPAAAHLKQPKRKRTESPQMHTPVKYERPGAKTRS
jgi:hypothetical protein